MGNLLDCSFGLWNTQHKWHAPDQPKPVFLTDMGAHAHTKGFFIPMTVITGVFYMLSLLAIRLCGQWGFIYPTSSELEAIFGWFSVLTSAGCAGCLIALSIRDTVHHHRLNWQFTASYYVLAFAAADSNLVEWLFAYYRYHKQSNLVAVSFYFKALISLAATASVIAYAGMYHYHDHSRSARFEWVVEFLWAIYIFLFCLDLLPAIHYERYPLNDLEKGVSS
ncbi:uncharacterized protein SOCG_16325 [Schizosaccharomyces octosporus yFS286]|uniref:CWH43-like N-terminal domain-containing protein n=1 Tax=Schizosaccharomyces octosporus (strain yFS286) TaxID=483514 RepID=S9R4W9_SCHOY|nr:uncharacterized protein SOCG_16325 [Schizosaccharomyces octosporus yFS286]EPX73395.1 hypothetical protein SOCG_16325 [Schizosaccharomyces octosporus yFS286]